MKGFTDKALLLFPAWEHYENRPTGYKKKMYQTARNIIDYCTSRDIEVYCFTTNEIAIDLGLNDIKWHSTLNRGDMFFMSKVNPFISGIKNLPMIQPTREIQDYCSSKYIITPDLSTEQRFEVLVQREKYAAKEIFKEYKLIFNIQEKNKNAYTPKCKENDGRIIIDIDNSAFKPKTTFSGNIMDTSDVVDISGSSRPVHLWEVK